MRNVWTVRGDGLSAETVLARKSANSSRSLARRTPIPAHAGRASVTAATRARRAVRGGVMAGRLPGDGIGRGIPGGGGGCQAEWRHRSGARLPPAGVAPVVVHSDDEDLMGF